ncbi:ATP-binding protein [Pseudomonas sp.]|uniref:ATP-binding protein n=1 Tax=Pseudomonas sp. TaxID=306 RepID=UPI0028A5862E|nr:ATP-binding protein [Pseudomonas sp.]
MSEAVTLATCEDEPIHIPAAIQPHGALIAFDRQGLVLSASENTTELLGLTPLPDQPLQQVGLPRGVREVLEEGLRSDEPWMNVLEASFCGALFDVIAHAHKGILYLEFERRDAELTNLSLGAHNIYRLVSQLQHQQDIPLMLESLVESIRAFSGYDRVMAYRFKPDLSGEVVAEARREGLVSYVGQHYPASDIPAQARRLFIENPTRLIADIAYRPVRLLPSTCPDGTPFDLSHSHLRSVSPIHCEYLNNMGVRASMSISIVVGDQLWGMFACHHMEPKVLPYPIRLSFQVLSQVCSAVVARLEAQIAAEQVRKAANLQLQLARQARDSEDLIAALTKGSADIGQLFDCSGVVVMLGGRVDAGDNPELADFAVRIVASLEADPELDLYHTERCDGSFTDSRGVTFCGVLAIRFHRQESGWLLWLRQPQSQTITWAGKPEKIEHVGPSGARLTPRGSFEAWEEVVGDLACAWSAAELSIAEKLRGELVEICLNRAAEIDHMRQRLIAVLGHDLRNPLQSISMAASMLSSSDTRSAELRKHITYSSGRMERLISQILEMSRLQAGLGLAMRTRDVDLSALVADSVREMLMAFPGMPLSCEIEPDLHALIDPDRYAQVVSNLLSNARHHGKPGRPVQLRLKREGDAIELTVRNETGSIAPDDLSQLFSPFKNASGSLQNKGGLGIGLYISQAIAQAHQGSIEVDYKDGVIVFTARVPG